MKTNIRKYPGLKKPGCLVPGFSRLFLLLFQQVADFGEQQLLLRRCGRFGNGSRSLFLFLHQPVHQLDHQEHAERQDREIHALLDECAVVPVDRFCRCGSLRGIASSGHHVAHRVHGVRRHVADFRDVEPQLREVGVSDQRADGRHQDVVHERRYDFAERAADDHADGHVDDIAAHRECLEVLKEFFHERLSPRLFMLERLAPQGRLIAFDRDPEAVAAAAAIKDPRFQIVHAPFSAMKERLGDLGIRQVDGIFLDIGVSSPQIDDPSRGFSFRFEGPLDMRMDTSCGETAAEWLARASVEEIAEVLADFGEERFAHRIARAIVEARSRAPITTTGALAKLVEAAVPKNRRDAAQHPATRTFQAVRIQVNHELDELKTTLESAGALLAPAGRLAVISFHSLEDRIVKRFFEKRLHPDRDLDPRLPMPAGFNAQPWFCDVIRILPTKSEAESNPRARSSVLRVGTRTARLWED